MIRWLRVCAIAITALVLSGNSAYAWYAEGYVRCDSNGSLSIDEGDLPLAGVTITINGVSTAFSGSATTNGAGYYKMSLPDFVASYTATLGGAPVVSVLVSNIVQPFSNATVNFAADDAFSYAPNINWLANSDGCGQLACWLTAGGAKFAPILGILAAEKGPVHNFGGNVNPGCNPDSGEGGQWNHLAHNAKLHFQGWEIQVVRCGNVDGIPPGSTSPATPFNFIEFEGTGTLKGLQGNKTEYPPVRFFARAEDRNEPGSSGNRDGAKIDRYFLNVTDATNTSLLLVDGDGDPATVDPVAITDGNLQIHISSCFN